VGDRAVAALQGQNLLRSILSDARVTVKSTISLAVGSRTKQVSTLLRSVGLDVSAVVCYEPAAHRSGPMPSDKNVRAAETMRRLLQHFRKLDRL
jgi:hypothetical protein